VRVVTWNVQWREREDWRARAPAIRDTLAALDPDVVCLQEVWATAGTSLAALLGAELGRHVAFGAPSLPPPPDPPERPDMAGVEVGVAVLSRWPLRSVAEHRFGSFHRPEVVALDVVADHPGGPLNVLTTCLDWEPELGSRRPAQAGALVRLVTDPARDGRLPVLLTGDLNTSPETPEIRALTAVMTDAWAAANGDEPGHTLRTANPLAPRAAWQIDRRIDYVLARPGSPAHPVVVERAFLAGEPVGGLHPADHDAVVADLRVP